MDGRLKLIEQKLIGIDSAAFQNLCDVYLSLREGELISISRTGTQLGKQKTVKGTPDTFFRLSNGNLRYVEYTTTDKGLLKKLKKDIDSCLDHLKTGVAKKDISKIIICYNSRTKASEDTELYEYAKEKKVNIELIGLDWLAVEIYSKYLILAKDILGIPLDTGQLLPLTSFIEEYNGKGGNLSTPLDNKFLHRESELIEIGNSLNQNDILIISGFPGVGKTKIALEALNNFLFLNKDYSGYAISKKDVDISGDLRIQLAQEKNYILLIDDGNRQLLNFKQILGIFRENRKGTIKLLITVRNYALNDVRKECSEYNPEEIVITKFSDDEIKELIQNEPFNIRHNKFQRKIIEISDGNARLAVMASTIAKKKQVKFLIGDVSDLYDSYFQTFIKDFDIFENKILLKTLGIVSFFYSIDRTNKTFIQKILSDFEIDFHEFNEAIEELHKRELVEVQYNFVRISEQVMSTYFFYKVFVKEEVLSFKTLMFNYFSEWENRFKDTIIPSNNSFGYSNVLSKINNVLDEYLQSIHNNQDKVYSFFTMFWFYKSEELLAYFHHKVKLMPEPINPEYENKYDTNDFVWDKDKLLDFMSNLFRDETKCFLPAIELAFEYCRKRPDKLPELIKYISDNIIFIEEDEGNDFKRQVLLFELVCEKFKAGKPHYIKAFFALAPTFLKHKYQSIRGYRKNSVTFQHYILLVNNAVKVIRAQILNLLFDSFENYPNESFTIIKNFSSWRSDTQKEILNHDLTLIIPFINNKLDRNNFEHIHYVQEFIFWLNKNKVKNDSYSTFKVEFFNEEYECFKKLDWNFHKGKLDYEYKDINEFQKIKEKSIRKEFVFKNAKDFSVLHNTMKHISAMKDSSFYGIHESVSIIMEENFIKDLEIGFALFESFLKDYPLDNIYFYRPIRLITNKSSASALRLWNLINSINNEQTLFLKLAFFESLSDEFVNDGYLEGIIRTVRSIDKRSYLNIDSFSKFDKVLYDKGVSVTEDILKIVSEKIDDKIHISLPSNFFDKTSDLLSNNFDLMAKSYLQQEKLEKHFDYNNNGLKNLVQHRPSFLLEYIKEFYVINRGDSHNRLTFVWEFEKGFIDIEVCINLAVEKAIYFGIREHPINIFFNNLQPNQKEPAIEFLFEYIKKYNADHRKMDAVFSVFRSKMNDRFEEALLLYLSLNTDLEQFKRISWRGNGGTYSGNVIIGEIHANEWRKILDMTDKAENQMELMPIKASIKSSIQGELNYAQSERKRKFSDPSEF